MNVPNSGHSLPRVLQAIAQEAGLDLDLDDVNAALGLPWMIGAVADEPDIAAWPSYAQDAFVPEAARLFGMTVREIHPPEAAHGLDRAAEFAQHFDASYRPLIATALSHSQAVLAWRGWPEPYSLSWGRIQRACTDGVGFEGTVFESDKGDWKPIPLVLIRPTTQVYVVESIAPTAPNAQLLWTMTVDHARRVLANELRPRFHITTGPAAMDVLTDRLRAVARADGIEAFRLRLSQVLDTWRGALRSGERFLEHIGTAAVSGARPAPADVRRAGRRLDSALIRLSNECGRPLSEAGPLSDPLKASLVEIRDALQGTAEAFGGNS